MIDSPMQSPIHSTTIDVGGGRMPFILEQLIALVAAYTPDYQHAQLLQDATRLKVSMAMTAGCSAFYTREQVAEYERSTVALRQALEGMAGQGWHLQETVDGLLQFVREEQHDQEDQLGQ